LIRCKCCNWKSDIFPILHVTAYSTAPFDTNDDKDENENREKILYFIIGGGGGSFIPPAIVKGNGVSLMAENPFCGVPAPMPATHRPIVFLIPSPQPPPHFVAEGEQMQRANADDTILYEVFEAGC
jgi:hypothetical protein